MAVDTNWIFGIAVMFGLAFAMTYATYKNIQTFFIFLTIFSAFAVWSDLIDLWILAINLIILTVILIFNVKNRGYT